MNTSSKTLRRSIPVTEGEYNARMDAILDVLEKIDDGWDFESVTNFCEIELARVAEDRRLAGYKPRVWE